MVKVSIIIPVYNVERYLEECMESVLGQTLKEIEIFWCGDGGRAGRIQGGNPYRRGETYTAVSE